MSMDRGYQPEPEDLNDRLSDDDRARLEQELRGGYGNEPIQYDASGEPLVPPAEDYEG